MDEHILQKMENKFVILNILTTVNLLKNSNLSLWDRESKYLTIVVRNCRDTCENGVVHVARSNTKLF